MRIENLEFRNIIFLVRRRVFHRKGGNSGKSVFFLFLAQACFLFAIPCSLLASSPEEASASAIASNALRVSPPGNWEMTGVLSTRVSPAKFLQPGSKEYPQSGIEHQEVHLRIQLRHDPDGSRWVVCRPTGPDEGRKGFKIHYLENGGVHIMDIENENPIKDRNASMFGSALNYEDFALGFLSWKDQRLMGEEKVRDRESWRLASYPAKGLAIPYLRVESWIDREYHGLLQAKAFDDGGQVVKEFKVLNLQEIEKVWIIRTLEINALPEGARSRLEIREAQRIKMEND